MINQNTTLLSGPYAALDEMSVQELQQMISEHPYCQNLHYLILEKNLQNSDREGGDHQQLLATVSTYATNREFLFNKINNPDQEESEESLELQPIPQSQKTLQKVVQATHVEEHGTHHAHSIFDDVLESELSDEESEHELLNELVESSSYFEGSVSDTPDHDTPFAGPNQLMPEEDAANGQSILEKILDATPARSVPFEIEDRLIDFLVAYSKTLTTKTIILDPNPSTFSSPEIATDEADPLFEIAGQEDDDDEEENEVGSPDTPKAKTLKRSGAKTPQFEIVEDDDEEEYVGEIVEKSISENEEIASETLAELLTSQHQYKKAIAMYERLILIFPEKSTFFAEKIKHLNKIS